jgi:hypothetical protein
VRLVAPRPELVYPDTYWRRHLAGRGDHEIAISLARLCQILSLGDQSVKKTVVHKPARPPQLTHTTLVRMLVSAAGWSVQRG